MGRGAWVIPQPHVSWVFPFPLEWVHTSAPQVCVEGVDPPLRVGGRAGVPPPPVCPSAGMRGLWVSALYGEIFCRCTHLWGVLYRVGVVLGQLTMWGRSTSGVMNHSASQVHGMGGRRSTDSVLRNRSPPCYRRFAWGGSFSLPLPPPWGGQWSPWL